ncbi:hypothetical protein ASE70_16775 [Sphingomonas sp. Leaf22]|nr:hypothetical protein ASE70_16775 [Sphingomonas sp. Leaf22]
MMDAFSALMRESLSGDDPTLRKCCLVRLIYEVRTIRKRLEFLVRLGSIGRTELVIMGMVPMFDWEWCRPSDKTGHSECWQISVLRR